MRALLQPISARIYFGKTASHRKRARLVQSRGAPPQAYWMSVKAAQQRGCAKRAFCGVCFLVAGGLKPGALVFVSGCGVGCGFGFGSGVAGTGVADRAEVRSPGGSSGFTGRTGRGFGGSLSFGTAGGGLLASGGVIASALAGLRIIINRRCCYDFFLRLLNDGLFDFDNGGIGNGGNYNVGLLLLRNLALKYSINMHIVNETVGVDKAGQDYKLSDYLQVKTLSQEASLSGDISFLRLTDASSGATMRKVRKVIPIQPKGASIWDETTGTL